MKVENEMALPITKSVTVMRVKAIVTQPKMNMILVVDTAITDLSMYDEVLLQVKQIQFLATMIADFFLQTLNPLVFAYKIHVSYPLDK